MSLPPESWRSRLIWSIPAAFILALWTIGVLGAAVTRFPDPYTFPEVLSRISGGGRDMFWPGEFGRGGLDEGTWVQLSPMLALIFWLPCLIPWRSRARRVAALVVALLIPAWFAPLAWALDPETFHISRSSDCIFGVATGEEWQEACVVLPAMTLWWALLVPLIVLTSRGRIAGEDECPACGYSTIGLTGCACPECGTSRCKTLPMSRVVG